MNPSPTRTIPQLTALKRFAIAITVLNVLGHTVLGFEQAWLHPVIALLAAYGTEMTLECVECLFSRRKPRFFGSFSRLVTFLLPAHISALAVAMLLYPSKNFMVIAFAAVVAIGSKALFRIPMDNGRRCHFLNPSNIGITVTLLVFPWVGIVPPYHFTGNVPLSLFWLIPGLIMFTGTLLNYKLTKRHPLILGWVGGFVLQAWLRSDSLGWIPDTTFQAALAPMSGVAFILFTFYMVTDPMTTPQRYVLQVAFGLAVALMYGLFEVARGVFAMFFALTLVCCVRGAFLYLRPVWSRQYASDEPRHSETSFPTVGAGEPALLRIVERPLAGEAAME